jgi:histidinol-phosphate aminotransferase
MVLTSAPLHLIRAEVRGERPYVVSTEADVPAKLDQNESPFDAPADLKEAAARYVREADWNRYPSDRPHRLQAALAAQLGVSKDSVLVGHGSNEIAHTLGLAFLDRDVPVVLPHPMFALYESVARMHGARIVSVDPGPLFGHDAGVILDAATESNATLTIVTSPNNPTGQVIPFEGLERLAAGVPGFLVIDEAYFEFLDGPTAVDLVRRHPNVLSMRTFSKAMGLAGLRVGYLVGDQAVVAEIEKARLPFVVDGLAEAVALALLERPELVAERVAAVVSERERLLTALEARGDVEVIPGAANFFLMRAARPAADLIADLASRGVRVRSMAPYRALGPSASGEAWVRVTVGAPAENRAFEVALHEVLAEAAG